MRVFLDTNVLLDVYLNRAGEPGSARVIAACGEPWNQGFVRVSHYWDGKSETVNGFAPVLELGKSPAWDVYLVYDQNTEWKDGFPKPEFWEEQLGISDETALDADKMTAEVNRLLQTGGK